MLAFSQNGVVLLATPPAFRPIHFSHAVDKNLNVFMEKPITVDGPSTRKMLQLGEASVKANLKVGVGLMSRHMRGMQELHKRIQDGQMGELVGGQCYWNGTGIWFREKNDPKFPARASMSEG